MGELLQFPRVAQRCLCGRHPVRKWVNSVGERRWSLGCSWCGVWTTRAQYERAVDDWNFLVRKVHAR